jgi:hypothetical protein
MEVKINREIRDYTEAIFFGMNLRQCICSALGAAAAVAAYFAAKPLLGTEAASWCCVLAAFPFILIGFVKYNGMTMERFFIAWVKSEILLPKRLVFRNTNQYFALLQAEDGKKVKKEAESECGKEEKNAEDA